jgi:mannitol-1-phosphate 5-dehydrogenase
MAKALIVGGGAIGRGFLPWELHNLRFDLFDISEELTSDISKNGGYTSYMTRGGSLVKSVFQPDICTSKAEDLDFNSYIVAFIAVGPRNCSKLPAVLSKLDCPIFSIENDPSSVTVIERVLNSSKVFFGVPDVITSSTSSPENLMKDKYALHTENGTLYLESSDYLADSLSEFLPNVVWASRSEMVREWNAKLYLHNTPHCVAAYLGHLKGKYYLHEAFDDRFVIRIVEGVIEEMILTLKREGELEHNFLEEYADKELRRFSNSLLYDPILRVAREPLRKLAYGGRLMGGLSKAMLAGVQPVYLNLGIAAALNYQERSDPDYKSMSQIDASFLRYFLDISPSAMESKFVVANYSDAKTYLKKVLKWN